MRQGSVAEGVFRKFDEDGSGTISENEFQLMCYNLDHCVTSEEVKVAVKVINTSGTGEINKDEFIKWWSKGADRWKQVKLDEKELKVRQAAATAFKKFDQDLSGAIDAKEFVDFYDNLKARKLTNAKKEDVFEALDSDKNGAIQFYEYVKWLDEIGTITNWVKVLPSSEDITSKKTPTTQNQALSQTYWAQYCNFPHASRAIISDIDGKLLWGAKGEWTGDAKDLLAISKSSAGSSCSIGNVNFGSLSSVGDTLVAKGSAEVVVVKRSLKVFLVGIGAKSMTDKLLDEVSKFGESLRQGGY